MIWCQQVEEAIKGYKLSKFINVTHEVPPKFLSSTDEISGKINQDFSNLEQQEQLLVSWLLSSTSEGLLTRIVGCATSFQIWEKIQVFFATQTRAKVDKFETQLKNAQKGSLSMNDYFLRIKNIVDSLLSVGYSISSSDHIEAIFEGLPSEYDTLITVVTTRTDLYTVDEIEYVILAQERRIEKSTKSLDSNMRANLATQHLNNMSDRRGVCL